MAKHSGNPEVSRKMGVSALVTFLLSVLGFYLGDRYGEAIASQPGNFFDHWGDAFTGMWPLILDRPLHLDLSATSLLVGLGMFCVVWLVWLRFVAFMGNYRAGEESGSARWGTLKEGKAFKDQTNEDNNLIFTQNYGLALHRPKYNPELDRNLNVLVIGGSGSGKTFNYVTPNIMQLNANYFITDPKGTLLKDAGYLFTDNGYEIKSFNTINLDESMHYNPLKYVKTDTDILSFVNCYIMNTNGDGKAGDPFWENAERMLYTALIALLRDWFPPEDYNLSGLLTLLSLAEAREDDENFRSPLDLLFLQIEDGKRYIRKQGGPAPAAASGPTGLTRTLETGGPQSDWSWEPSLFRKTLKGADSRPKLDAQGNPIIVEPAKCGGLSPDEDFALMNYKNFKVAAGKTLKSIIIFLQRAPRAHRHGWRAGTAHLRRDGTGHAGGPGPEDCHLRHPLRHGQDPLVPVRRFDVAVHRPALPEGAHGLRRQAADAGALYLRRVCQHRHHPADRGDHRRDPKPEHRHHHHPAIHEPARIEVRQEGADHRGLLRLHPFFGRQVEQHEQGDRGDDRQADYQPAHLQREHRPVVQRIQEHADTGTRPD